MPDPFDSKLVNVRDQIFSRIIFEINVLHNIETKCTLTPSFPFRFSGLRAPLRYGCPPLATHLSLPCDMRYRAGVRSSFSAFILQAFAPLSSFPNCGPDGNQCRSSGSPGRSR